MDIGYILWNLAFITPLFIIVLIWKYGKQNKIKYLLIGSLLIIILSLMFYSLSILIMFEDGLGS
jgi:hypothetical protein